MSDLTFPAIGHVYEAKFGDLAYRLDFADDGKKLSFTDAEGTPMTVEYTAVNIAPQLFMVYWTEPAGTTVTHVEDFGRGVVHTNITMPDLTFLNFTGTLTKLN